MSKTYDAIIVGGGIAGGALATVLARRGIAVAVLERDRIPVDRVRGEFMAPWGVAELKRLGLFETLATAGGVVTKRAIPYDENAPGDMALPLVRDLSALLPDVPGAFCMSHPAMCATLTAAAEAAGAAVLRGVEKIEVTSGSVPTVSFTYDGAAYTWRPSLVIGADGRNSHVRAQLGLAGC